MQSDIKNYQNYIKKRFQNLSKIDPKTFPKTSAKTYPKTSPKTGPKLMILGPLKIKKTYKNYMLLAIFDFKNWKVLEATWSDIGTGSAFNYKIYITIKN